METKYNIELTKKQLKILSFISDRYSRLIAGQLNIALEDVLLEAAERHRKDIDKWDLIKEVESDLDNLQRKYWNLKNGQYYGVGYSDIYDMLTDINHVIRYQLFIDSGEKKMGCVDEYPPHKWSKEPLIKVNKL